MKIISQFNNFLWAFLHFHAYFLLLLFIFFILSLLLLKCSLISFLSSSFSFRVAVMQKSMLITSFSTIKQEMHRTFSSTETDRSSFCVKQTGHLPAVFGEHFLGRSVSRPKPCLETNSWQWTAVLSRSFAYFQVCRQDIWI